jgi:hypothetical protein
VLVGGAVVITGVGVVVIDPEAMRKKMHDDMDRGESPS